MISFNWTLKTNTSIATQQTTHGSNFVIKRILELKPVSVKTNSGHMHLSAADYEGAAVLAHQRGPQRSDASDRCYL